MLPQELLNLGFSKELAVLLIAALPISELRGAIPVAINLFHFPWYYAFVIAVIGNLLPVPLILLFLNSTSKMLCRIPWFERMFNWLFEHTKKRGSLIEKYGIIGLALFVAVPLPATGAWTASLAAVLFGMRFRDSLLSIAVGVFIAGVIVTCLSLLGWIGATIAGLGLMVLAASGFWKLRG